MALTKQQLDEAAAKGCQHPDCDHGPECTEDHSGVVFFHGRCHPHARVDASYQVNSGQVVIVCAECHQLIVEIAVAETPGRRMNLSAGESRTVVHEIVSFLLAEAREMPPESFRAMLNGGIIANVVGNLPDEYWRRFLKNEICDEPGCDCYVRTEQMLAALDAQRDDWKTHRPPPE